MKGELNKGLQPPESLHDKEYGYEDELNGWIEVIKQDFKPEDVFDLYNHDREVAKNFLEWYGQSGWMPASKLGGKYSLHEGYINTDPKAPDKVNFEQLWEIYCTEIIK